MKKGLLAIIVSICFLVTGIFAVNGIGALSAYASNLSLDDGIYEFHPTIETFAYELDEPFPVSFAIESETPATSVSFTTNGFVVTQSPFLSQGSVKAGIKYDGITANPLFTVYANLANGCQLQASIFGIIENDVLYINGNSYASARDIYYADALESGAMTQEEYEVIFNGNGGEITNTTSRFMPLAADDTWVFGTLQWIDDWGNIHPLHHTQVTVYDREGGWLFGWWGSNLGTVYTNASGDFSLGFSNRSGGRNIFIRVWPEGENTVVKTGANNEYVWRSRTSWDVATGSTTTINRIFNMRDACAANCAVAHDHGDDNLGRAFQVSQATIVGARYASAMRGSNMQIVTVRYPHNETATGCFNRNSNDTMYIIGNRPNDTNRIGGQLLRSYASWDVIMHEYGHFVQDKLNIEDNSGGWHNGGNMYNHYMSHHGGAASGNCLNAEGNITCANPSAANAKDKAIKLAYAEAWPSILAGMAQQYYINLGQLDNSIQTVGDSEYDSYNRAWMDYNNATRGGEATEDTVIGVLWDLYDNDTAEAHDRISLGHSAWWTLKVGGQPKTFSAVANRFHSHSLGNRHAWRT